MRGVRPQHDSMNTQELFSIVAERMRHDLKITRAALTHPGLRGAAFEESFRSFLRSYLPKALDISTGILVDADGRHSRQLDVIISDAAKTPIFYSVGDTRVIPIECAYMVIEVKAMLNAGALTTIRENMESVRQLTKRAYVADKGDVVSSTHLYGRSWDIWPVNYFVFAYDSTDLVGLSLVLRQQQESFKQLEPARIDTVCVLDKGVICNRLADGKFDALPEPGSTVFACQTTDALLLFYSLISRYSNQAWLPHFRFTDYLGQMTFGVQSPAV